MNQDDLPPLPAAGPDLKSRPSRARYDKVRTALDLKWRRRELQPERMMREVVDALWDAFGDTPWSWCGFWLRRAHDKAFHPGPARPERAATEASAAIAEAFAAAEPRARPDGAGAVIAVPVFDKSGQPWAVFEVRSPAKFDEMDARWIERLLKPFQGINPPASPAP